MGQENMRDNDYYIHPRNSMSYVQPVHLVHVPRHVNMNRPLKWQVGTQNALGMLTSRSKSEVTVYPNSVGLSIWDLLQKNSQATHQNSQHMEHGQNRSSQNKLKHDIKSMNTKTPSTKHNRIGHESLSSTKNIEGGPDVKDISKMIEGGKRPSSLMKNKIYDSNEGAKSGEKVIDVTQREKIISPIKSSPKTKKLTQTPIPASNSIKNKTNGVRTSNNTDKKKTQISKEKFGAKPTLQGQNTSRMTKEKVQITTKKSEQITIKQIGKTRGIQAKKSNTMRGNKILKGINL